MSSNLSTAEIGNSELLEELYHQYIQDPSKLDSSWHQYFTSISKIPDKTYKLSLVISSPLETKVEHLIEAYRKYGHLFAKVNPIALKEVEEPQELKLEMFGLSSADLSAKVRTFGILPQEQASLEEVIQALRALYCDRIGFEYKDITTSDVEKWIQHRIESSFPSYPLSIDQKKFILESLNKSEILESFLHTKYVGQKRFSLEGAETLIPMLALLVDQGASEGIEEIILGMAHRGRLNVLSNILNKSYKKIFLEFDENHIPESVEGAGDVKYHKGYQSDEVLTHSGNKIKIILAPNPSHLESVDCVVEGLTRAKQTLKGDKKRKKIIPLLIHGDAALSGQGVVYETLQFCKLPGYTTGGTIHFVINNQIGFTTIPRDLRSTYYCTDIAKAFNAPVFHVNAEDPEGCVAIALLALEIRQKFHCDVFIDIHCYRKYGHNESDEPAYTQPHEYALIRKKKPIRELYRNALIGENVIDQQVIDKLEEEFKEGLHKIHEEVTSHRKNGNHQHPSMELPNQNLLFNPFPTGVPKEVLLEVTNRFTTIPEGFKIHPKLGHVINERSNMVKEGKHVDWGMAEQLAYATLLWQGIPVRLSGQDSCRGTFSHRHAIWVDQAQEKDYFPLAHLKPDQGRFEVYNSSLSEFAVLGFEYGYSVAYDQCLTIWEAQFGDFSNGAQVIIDQYLISGEQKWGQKSGLTLFLPHGYEGQGPEHSSGRLERFLSLAGNDNIQVVYPTTPAQFFHLLRRQVLRPLRKPLVVFTPKGLLRHPACVSSIHDFEKGAFQEILEDPKQPQEVKRLILCSGRIYYDLIEENHKRENKDLAFVRIEQLYPLNQDYLKKIIYQYSNIKEVLWVQEEHQNMGAWNFIYPYLVSLLPKGIELYYRGRSSSATPATGSHSRHKQEYTNLMNQVFHL